MEKIKIDKKTGTLLVASLIILAVAIRVIFFFVYSMDTNRTEAGWYDVFIEVGRIDAFKEIFYNYPPPLLYLIDVATLFRFIPKEAAIRLISMIFDFIGAFAFYKIIALKYPRGIIKWIGFFALLFLPTVFIESGMWGQSDIIYTDCLLLTFYFLLKEKNLPAIFFFSVAFAFKLQTLFFGPIFLILFLRKKFPFWMFFVIPVVYFISVVPAWLAGGPLDKLLLMYFTQFDTYHSLSMRAPNLYLFVNAGDYYDQIVKAGMIITLLLVFVYVALRWRKWKDLSDKSLCFDAALLLILIPFCLPKMHDRYFFTGGVFLLLLAFYEPKLIWTAILSQASSLFAFIPYFSGWSDNFARVGAVINVFLVVGLILEYRSHLKELEIRNIPGEAQHAQPV